MHVAIIAIKYHDSRPQNTRDVSMWGYMRKGRRLLSMAFTKTPSSLSLHTPLILLNMSVINLILTQLSKCLWFVILLEKSCSLFHNVELIDIKMVWRNNRHIYRLKEIWISEYLKSSKSYKMQMQIMTLNFMQIMHPSSF